MQQIRDRPEATFAATEWRTAMRKQAEEAWHLGKLSAVRAAKASSACLRMAVRRCCNLVHYFVPMPLVWLAYYANGELPVAISGLNQRRLNRIPVRRPTRD